MPQETKSHGTVSEPASLAGWAVDVDAAAGHDAHAIMDVLEKAFDYRGDITLTLHGGREITGYLFDRRRGKTPADSVVRVMPPQGDTLSIAYAEVRRVAFSDRDPAAGKSFETWLKKYVEKKTKGEAANIYSEPLE